MQKKTGLVRIIVLWSKYFAAKRENYIIKKNKKGNHIKYVPNYLFTRKIKNKK